MLESAKGELCAVAGKVKNGFSDEFNLYHLLCGMIFDGALFGWLADQGAEAVKNSTPASNLKNVLS